MLDGLPDTILLELIERVPQLSLVNKRLFGLSEWRAHKRLLAYYDYREELLEELTSDVQICLHAQGWNVVEDIACRDYCFFGPEHLVESDTYPKGQSNQLKDCDVINGAPWGLYILNWATQCLEYSTFLRAGSYDLLLDVCASQLGPLNGTKISIVNSPHITQHFRNTPSLFSLEKQWKYMTPKHSAASKIFDQPGGSEAAPASSGCSACCCNPLEVDSTSLRVGTLRVNPGQNSDWAEVTVRIESLDWSEPLDGLVLNFLCFEPRPPGLDIATDWTFQPNALMGRASHALPSIYKRANERKRKWFQEPVETPTTSSSDTDFDSDTTEYSLMTLPNLLPLAT